MSSRSADVDLSREDLLQRLAARLAEQPTAHLKALLAQLERPKPRISRGPRPVSHAKARQIAQRFDEYQALHRGRSVKALAQGFLATLPPHLRSGGNSRSRGTQAPPPKNVITRGRELNRQRPALRRLVSVLRDCERLAARGTHHSSASRCAARAGRAGRPQDLADIKRLTREYEFLRIAGLRALLGDAYSDSFISFEK